MVVGLELLRASFLVGWMVRLLAYKMADWTGS